MVELRDSTTPGDGDLRGDEDEDFHPSLFKKRLLRLEVGGDSAACWGPCSTEDRSGRGPESGCLLARPVGGSVARFGSEAERRAPRPLDFLWLPMRVS